MWKRGDAGAQNEGFSQENRAIASCTDDVTPLFSVNLPGFRRGDPAWSPVNAKNFISMPASSARDQLCPLRGFAPYDRFFLYPTKPSKCAECRPRHSVEGFSSRLIRALAQGPALPIDSGDHTSSAPKTKVFRRKTEQLRRAPTTSRRYSRSICPVFVGATLRGRPSMRKISFQCRPRRHATNFVHFAALLLMTGFSFIPQKFCFCGILPCKARHIVHFSRAATRVSGSGDHIGSPLRCPCVHSEIRGTW